jgi:hypothetical protein
MLLPTGSMSINRSEKRMSVMEAAAWGVTVLTTMISSESGRCGVGVEVMVAVRVRLGLGTAVEVQIGVTFAGVALPAGVGEVVVEKKGFQARKVSAVTTINNSEAPVIHQPARTR